MAICCGSGCFKCPVRDWGCTVSINGISTRVVNKRSLPHMLGWGEETQVQYFGTGLPFTCSPKDVRYVGRPTKFGNPFIVGKHGDQQQCVDLYREWVTRDEQFSLRLQMKRELVGKHLECWCAPLPCHADVILEVISSITSSSDEPSPHPLDQLQDELDEMQLWEQIDHPGQTTGGAA